MFCGGVVLAASGALTGCASAVASGGITQQNGTSHWQEYNQAVQDECDKQVVKIATEAGVTADNINRPDIQRALRELRWQCAHQQGLTS
ncbi:hypothetical protein C171_00150 [Pseudomonas phage YMC11/06/C171_PPU_BP]|uniref:Uncharacterized protein n=1 Tax=Pseudomonas phage YMC11/06/C171_PPU_BP TaxID=1777063 RepID=A0A127KNY3_9CAUD|nr:hypothetical protein BH776_gp15 [Pseudomonas phage YMC11/06/C171_PPU_BP]AMO43639.1 hypothetical protein C171_00150 [Pseudomonas phage YMC11/06/C171_PPU_BP]